MSVVIPFTYKNSSADLLNTSQRLDVRYKLLALLAQLDDTQMRGLLFMVDMGGGKHEYGLAGSYETDPRSAYIPAAKTLHELSGVIHKGAK